MFDLIESEFLNLNNIFRFSNTKLIERESTAEHTMTMQLIALYFYNKYPDLPIEDICMRILYHDLDECVSADIPRSIKYASKESYDIINKETTRLLKESKINEHIICKFQSSKHDGSWNGHFVQVLDVLQCLLKLYNEYLLQHTTILKTRVLECCDNLTNSLTSLNPEFYHGAEIITEINSIKSMIESNVSK